MYMSTHTQRYTYPHQICNIYRPVHTPPACMHVRTYTHTQAEHKYMSDMPTAKWAYIDTAKHNNYECVCRHTHTHTHTHHTSHLIGFKWAWGYTVGLPHPHPLHVRERETDTTNLPLFVGGGGVGGHIQEVVLCVAIEGAAEAHGVLHPSLVHLQVKPQSFAVVEHLHTHVGLHAQEHGGQPPDLKGVWAENKSKDVGRSDMTHPIHHLHLLCRPPYPAQSLHTVKLCHGVGLGSFEEILSRDSGITESG